MVRRIASQVHRQAARLMRGSFIKNEPAWFQAVLDHPPLPLPPRTPPSSRIDYDTSDSVLKRTNISKNPKKLLDQQTRPLPIAYLEDDVRRQFFTDHPFEAFRPVLLIEGRTIHDEHPIQGKSWTRLRQRGRNPRPEDAVQFTVNLHKHHELSLNTAYTTAVAQFRSLRAEHHVATVTAALEADHYGAEFGPGENEAMFEEETKNVETWKRTEELDQGAQVARKKWKAIVERQGTQGEWSRGEKYVRLWKEGVRPTYLPALTEPVLTPDGLCTEDAPKDVDFMDVLH